MADSPTLEPHRTQLLYEPAKSWLEAANESQYDIHGSPAKFVDLTSPDLVTMKYVKRPDKERTTHHWGQSKLFLAEMDLVLNFDLIGKYHILYAGMAPYSRGGLFLDMFPELLIDGYDPGQFSNKIRAYAANSEVLEGYGTLSNVHSLTGPTYPPNTHDRPHRVNLHQTYFTDDTAEAWVEYIEDPDMPPVVFISDIRIDHESVDSDMDSQMRWTTMLMRASRDANKRCVAMLKFRLPWGAGTTKYLPGKIMYQTYFTCTGTEARLVVDLEDLEWGEDGEIVNLVEYDNVVYEEHFMFYNTVYRARKFDYGDLDIMGEVPGLCCCADCWQFVDTVRQYLLASHAEEPSTEEVRDEILRIIPMLSDGKRSLITKTSGSSTRKWRKK